ncbi:MAG: DUF58 domain-containing protein [Chloroflexi bacterium]|nr:DUF58 domain-containing protein [Chloroflexota bacterium]
MARTTIKLNSRIPLIVAGALLLLQIFSPAPAIMFTLVVLLGVLAVSYLWARQLRGGLSLQRQRRYGWAQVGDVIEERFTMHNDAWVPVLWAEVHDYSDLPGYHASRAIGLGARYSTRWTTEGVCERRGVYTLGPAKVSTGDPFGLFDVTLHHDYSETFVVYPPIAALPPLIEPRGMMRGSARANARSLDLTTNASSVRHYVPGDALNRIHWRSTARRSTPEQEEIFVKEFDLEPSGDLWIILDMDRDVHVGEGLESTEEYAVTLAASLADQMLRDNHAVGLVTHNGEPVIVPPQKGHQQLWNLLRVLAGAYATAPIHLEQLLDMFEPLMGRGMSAVVITPSTHVEWIEGVSQLLRHGIHPTGLLLDGHSFDPSRSNGNMRGIVGALADLGVAGHIIAKDFRFRLITQKRQQRPTFKTLGTGRVIMVDTGADAEWVSVGETREEVS